MCNMQINTKLFILENDNLKLSSLNSSIFSSMIKILKMIKGSSHVHILKISFKTFI